MIKKLAYFFSSLLITIFLAGCSSSEKNLDTAEGLFESAQEYEKNDRFEEATRRYQEVKSKFPYSKLSVEADLALADVFYKKESFAEAQIAYQAFRELHPRHARSDYVLFQIGMSYFKQLPSTIDRDLSLAPNAIQTFDEFMRIFPQSQYREEALKNKNQALSWLAEKEKYIADFYFKRSFFESALNRYEGLIKKYPTSDLVAAALSQAVISSHKSGDLEKRKELLNQLQTQFPNSGELEAALSGIKQ